MARKSQKAIPNVSPYFKKSDSASFKSENRRKETVRYVSPYFESNFKKAAAEGETIMVIYHGKTYTIEEWLKIRKSANVFKSNSAEEGPKRKQIRKSITLSAAEKKDEAYRRRSPENTWVPPRSEIGLLQEDHVHDPWRVLVICILLNVTTGDQVRKVLDDFFNLCPNAKVCTEVAVEEISQLIHGLGNYKKRAVILQRFSRKYLSDDWTHVTQLPGIGKYGGDAYAIFCNGKWDQVQPEDHKLVPYWEFLHSIKHKL